MEQLKIELHTGQGADTRVLRISGPLILKTLFEFQEVLRGEEAAITIIDLSAVPYADSAALGSLLGFHVSCRQKGRCYALIGAPERLETLFRVTRVDQILIRFPTIEEAERSLRASTASGN